MINCSIGKESSILVLHIISIYFTPWINNESISNLFLIKFRLRWAMIILFRILMCFFLTSTCHHRVVQQTESDLILESNTSWTEFLTLELGKNFFLFFESRSYQNFRNLEIRILAKLMHPVLFIYKPYSFSCNSSLFWWWMQYQLVELRKLINLLLLMSDSALFTRKADNEIIIFAVGVVFCIKRWSFPSFRHFIWS